VLRRTDSRARTDASDAVSAYTAQSMHTPLDWHTHLLAEAGELVLVVEVGAARGVRRGVQQLLHEVGVERHACTMARWAATAASTP
jgi:hypothetical protein